MHRGQAQQNLKPETIVYSKASLSVTFVYFKNILFKSDTVAHTCNLSYLGGRNQEDHSSRPVWANSSQDPISTNKKLGVVVHTYHPS
jgi:hypothetical protein